MPIPFACIFVVVKKVLPYFFIFLVISFSTKNLWRYGMFKLNQAYITSAFCVNKDRPALKCDGKCYLKKTIKQSQETEEKAPNLKDDEAKTNLIHEFVFLFLPTSRDTESRVGFFTQFWIPENERSEIFHPPKKLV
jgi:hypothetical protein